MSELSTKPYLIRAIYEWCSDSGYRPYIAVVVDERTQVPFEFVRNGEIVLNVSADATNHLSIGNDLIEFEARFNRVARQVSVPIANVSAIYAAENGHGMAFEVPKAQAVPEDGPSGRNSPVVPSGEDAAADSGEADPPDDAADTDATPKSVPRRRATRATKTGDAPASPAVSLVPVSSVSASDSGRSDAVPGEVESSNPSASDDPSPPDTTPPRKGGRPRLTRVK